MAIEQIERDIAALEVVVKEIAAEFHRAYTSYLTALGRAVRQQLILASYHLCTQGYPEAFLSLSFNQRQQLQQAIRSLGKDAVEQLITELKVGEHRSQEPGMLDSTQIYPAKPMDLVQWQQNLEQAIADTLKKVSRETNSLLQQTGILPSKLPPPVLEVALDASEAAGETMASPPNLLKLVIETEHKEESQESTVTNIIAINMRLSEIEFADADSRAGRNQIKHLETKARSLFREYLKKQQERSIASAEVAWRASWFED